MHLIGVVAGRFMDHCPRARFLAQKWRNFFMLLHFWKCLMPTQVACASKLSKNFIFYVFLAKLKSRICWQFPFKYIVQVSPNKAIGEKNGLLETLAKIYRRHFCLTAYFVKR